LDQLQLRRDVLQDNMLKLHRLHLDLLLAPFALLQLQRQLLREPPGQLPRQLRKQNQDRDEDEERGEGEDEPLLLLLLLVRLHLQQQTVSRLLLKLSPRRLLSLALRRGALAFLLVSKLAAASASMTRLAARLAGPRQAWSKVTRKASGF
jgi:hypothetical protein